MKRSSLLGLLCLMIIIMSTPSLALAFGEGCAIYRTIDQTIPNITWTAISFDAERRDDSLQCHAASGTAMSIAEGYAGWYAVSGSVYWDGMAAVRYLGIRLNGGVYLAVEGGYKNDAPFQTVTTVFYLNEGDHVELMAYQNSGNNLHIASAGYYSPEFRMVRLGPGSHPAFNSIQNLPGVASTPQPPQAHASNHQDGGSDEINVAGLSGILTDTQDAGWLQGLSITMTAPTDGQVLAWDTLASEWQPQEISATAGGFTMPEVITTVISGTVPVIITNTYQFTESLSSGHDMAIIRSFTYGEASITIGLFVVAALLGLHLLFVLQRRN